MGSLSYEWQITDPSPANHGDNWMLIADCQIWAIPPGSPEITVNPVTFSETGKPGFAFTGEPGWTYQIEHTSSFNHWHHDLPNATFTITESARKIQFTDPTPRKPASTASSALSPRKPTELGFSSGRPSTKPPAKVEKGHSPQDAAIATFEQHRACGTLEFNQDAFSVSLSMTSFHFAA